jgi:anti-sigma regulatory factor (Ser/Thr protein kinase)
MDEIVLTIARNLGSVCLAASFARKVCLGIEHPSVDEDFVNATELAVSEACTNAVVHHRGGGEEGRIMVCFEVWHDKIVMNIKEQGPGFDIATVPPPEFDKHFAGGYGIHIIRSKMDEVQYFRRDDWNVLSMTKFFGLAREAGKSNRWKTEGTGEG